MHNILLGEVFWHLFPDDHKYLTFLKKVFRHEFRKNGFRRISTAMKYNKVLRENSELGIMKAYIDNNVVEEIQPVYFYYMSRFFPKWSEEIRIWAEILWENDPILDAILIYITYWVLTKVWLWEEFSIRINSSGVEKERLKYSEELFNFYSDKKHLLTPESLELLDTNPMLILSSVDEDEQILSKNAPVMTKFLKKDSKAHYAKFKEYLDLLEVPYTEDNTLIAPNEYCTHNIWEFRHSETNNLISSGFRYNTLWTQLWSPKEVPAVWFHTKVEYVISLLREKNIKIKNKDSIDLFFVQLWDDAKKVVLPISLKAREAGINTVVSLGTPSMKEQILKANRSGAKYIVIVWFMEAKNGIFQVRNVEAGTQEEIKKEDLIDYVIDKIWKDSLDFYCPARDLLTE